MKIAFGTKLIFIKRHHGTRARARARVRKRKRERYERAGERWSIDYNRNERTQRHINVSKDPTGRAHVCGCIWRICGRARPETVVIPVLIRLPVKLLPGDRHFVACPAVLGFYTARSTITTRRDRPAATFVIILQYTGVAEIRLITTIALRSNAEITSNVASEFVQRRSACIKCNKIPK